MSGAGGISFKDARAAEKLKRKRRNSNRLKQGMLHVICTKKNRGPSRKHVWWGGERLEKNTKAKNTRIYDDFSRQARGGNSGNRRVLKNKKIGGGWVEG